MYISRLSLAVRPVALLIFDNPVDFLLAVVQVRTNARGAILERSRLRMRASSNTEGVTGGAFCSRFARILEHTCSRFQFSDWACDDHAPTTLLNDIRQLQRRDHAERQE